jgi:hypothetical protein
MGAVREEWEMDGDDVSTAHTYREGSYFGPVVSERRANRSASLRMISSRPKALRYREAM